MFSKETARSWPCAKRSLFPKESESPGKSLLRKPDKRKACEYVWFHSRPEGIKLLTLYEGKDPQPPLQPLLYFQVNNKNNSDNLLTTNQWQILPVNPPKSNNQHSDHKYAFNDFY